MIPGSGASGSRIGNREPGPVTNAQRSYCAFRNPPFDRAEHWRGQIEPLRDLPEGGRRDAWVAAVLAWRAVLVDTAL